MTTEKKATIAVLCNQNDEMLKLMRNLARYQQANNAIIGTIAAMILLDISAKMPDEEIDKVKKIIDMALDSSQVTPDKEKDDA